MWKLDNLVFQERIALLNALSKHKRMNTQKINHCLQQLFPDGKPLSPPKLLQLKPDRLLCILICYWFNSYFILSSTFTHLPEISTLNWTKIFYSYGNCIFFIGKVQKAEYRKKEWRYFVHYLVRYTLISFAFHNR